MVDKNFIGLNKPDITRFESYLPTAFSSELTLLQKVNKIIQDLNRNFDLTNEIVDYLNRFIESFDEKLYETLEDVLTVWLEDGRLADIIREVINDEVIEARTDYLGHAYLNLGERLDSEKAESLAKWNEFETDIDEVTTQLSDIAINVKTFGVVGDGVTDDTEALQTVFNLHTHVYFPTGTYLVSDTINISRSGASIRGVGGQYQAQPHIKYTGSDTLFDILASVDRLIIKNVFIEGLATGPHDYFNTGSVGIDITKGWTSVLMEETRMQGFETLVFSNGNSFYNKFINNHFNKFKIGLSNFSNNNMLVEGNYFGRFNNAIIHGGSNGPLNIINNSFEIFNGTIVSGIGDEKGVVRFEGNYVEIYPTADLPTNFPVGNYALPGKFGGNVNLFGGPFGSLIIENNEMQLQSVYRIVQASKCDYFVSRGNNLHLYQIGNSLERMFIFSEPLKSLFISDRLGVSSGTFPSTVKYNQTAIIGKTNRTPYYFYDCIADKELFNPFSLRTLSLSNGWVPGSTNYGYPRAFLNSKGLELQGVITGTNKTSNLIFTLPENERPTEYGNNLRYTVRFISYTDLGIGEKVVFEYTYATGEFRLVGSPTNTNDILLDGITIPLWV